MKRSFICHVNEFGEPQGKSHIVLKHKTYGLDLNVKPILACGIDSLQFNWTIRHTAPTEICKKCLKKVK